MYKKYFEGKKAVFFDLDGTVVKKTEELKIESLQKTLNDNDAWYVNASEYAFPGCSFENTFKTISTLSRLPKEKTIKEWVGIATKDYIDLIKKSDFEETEGFWLFADELKNEKGIKIALVTNSMKEITNEILNKLKLTDLFDLVICGDDVKKIKPSPEIYNKASKTLGIKSKDILVFEDSLVGAEAAKEAGMELIIIWDEVTPKEYYKGKVLDFMPDFSSLYGHLDETKFEYVTRQLKEATEERRASLRQQP